MLNELRQSLRSLRRVPGLAAVSVLTVALGVGAGTALFSVVKAVLLNGLPYPNAGRLAWVAEVNPFHHPISVAPGNFADWVAQNRSFATLAAFSTGPITAGTPESLQRTNGSAVSEDFFEVLGARPAMGRLFSPAEQQPNAPLTLVLGYGLWQRGYGGDPNILGRSVRVLGQPATVIGVMPPGFAFPAKAELWAPAGIAGQSQRAAHNYRVVGRLRDGVTFEQAERDLGAIQQRLKQQFPGPFMSPGAAAVPLRDHLVENVRTPLLILFGAVGLLLLIVCVNVANLLLVRVTTRGRELAVRTALGAARRHLVRQLLTESLLLAAAGGALGFLVAFWSMDLLRIVLPADLPGLTDVRIDHGVVLFAFALSTAALLFGTLPAWRASRMNINDSLKAGARGQTAGRRSQRTQAALVVSEVALSLLLLAGAGLLLRSFEKLRSVDPGFRAQGVLTAGMSFRTENLAIGQIASTYRGVLDRVRALPGVEAAGVMQDLPLDQFSPDGHFVVESRRNELPAADAGHSIVSPGALEALGIPLLRGRRFTEADRENALPVAVINAAMAREFWGGRDPIGDRIWFDSFEQDKAERWLTVVGVVGDVRQGSLTARPYSIAYVCYAQLHSALGQLGETSLLVRTPLDPASLVPAVRAAAREANPEAAPVFRPMSSIVANATARQRFQMQVLAAFALLALVLAAVGLYGVLSYTVNSNRDEIGIRMALGAEPAAVFRMVALRAVRLTAGGAAAGLAGCLAVRTVVQKVIFGIGPSDPAALLAAAAVLLVVALAACWFPARRAMRLDPVIALREE